MLKQQNKGLIHTQNASHKIVDQTDFDIFGTTCQINTLREINGRELGIKCNNAWYAPTQTVQ